MSIERISSDLNGVLGLKLEILSVPRGR